MNLHEDTTLFKSAVRATAQKIGILDLYVEKDYWVTKALKAIFTSDISDQVVFKGGTALSKCFGMIERFSEDIDLVTLRSSDNTGAQLKKRLKEISKVVNAVMPEVDTPGITNKLGMIRKTVHEYPKIFTGAYGQVRDKVILESSWLGHYEPFHSHDISSYIHDMMVKSRQMSMIKTYDMAPFSVQVLDVRRTFCEKVLSLVRFSHTDTPINDLRMKIRHLYDLNQLLKNTEVNEFYQSVEFENMLNRVGNDDVEGFKNNNLWLTHHPKEALIFADPNEVWLKIENVYSVSFKPLVFGVFPEREEILKTLLDISVRLKQINWTVSVD